MITSNLFKLSLITCALTLAGCGSSSDIDDEGKATNTIPTVSVKNVSVGENSQVTLNATATDTDGSISTYSWEVTSGHTLSLTGSDSNAITFTAPSVFAEGDELTFKVVVTDNDGATAEASNIVTVSNIVPTATIAEQTVDEKANVSITANVDGNGDGIASYLWEQTSGSMVEFISNDTENLTFTAPEISADEVIGLKLTVTDNDDDEVMVESLVNVNQLTIPLTIVGLATDSPITNGEITVNVVGRDITIDVTADANGNYNVDLILDDSEADAFISIIAHGVAEQANAGLITLLGTAGQLSAKEGEDNILTEDENFAVNITNITTAQYALIKLANNGDAPANDAELESLTQALNYDEVITLATAIKVAIDKAADNPELGLPESITDTLALVENVEATQAYVQKVIDEPEFQEAQEEIFEDDNLVDTSSAWNVPEIYYALAPGSLSSGMILRFNQDGTGSSGAYSFTWEQATGEISADIIEDPTRGISESFPTRMVNGEMVQVRAHNINLSYDIKRLNSGENTDVILFQTAAVIRFPDGELADEPYTFSSAYSAVKPNATIDITHAGAGIAYLPFRDDEPDNSSIISLNADEFTLNADGTAHSTVLDIDFTWQVEDGVLKLNAPSEDDNTYVPTWKQLTTGLSINQFAHEFIENGEINPSDDYISNGAILTAPMAWQTSEVAGIYTYDRASFTDPLQNFWFELHDNGDAETYSSDDNNGDGSVTEDEIFIQYGNWTVNSDGTLVIARVRHQDGNYTEECRYESEICLTYHERTWRLIGQKGNAYGVFHKHDFRYSNFGWGDDGLYYDIRTLYEVATPPVQHSILANKARLNRKQQIKSTKENVNEGTRFSVLEPEFK